MPVTLAVHPSLLALAVVTTAVRSLHNTGGATSVVTMSVAMAMSMSMPRIGHSTARLVQEHR